ncbi:hypothetical protein [Hydrogenophaga sp.]|uniref:hypothetical protein n=1 Tax=Hydrogenophaga sp. TaxID=1904254 RepID=UPI0019B50865|nr:hypothetical protein [Hydrogenophaga sp.]MBD3893103.1 hypothetical protein [Hydrogenophaga sp.]
MNRCLITAQRTPRRALLAGAALVLAASAAAQAPARPFPEQALRAELVVLQPPEITLNGKPDRLSPGARIHDPRQLQVLSGSLVGQQLPVKYLRDNLGLVHRVWILSPTEAEWPPQRAHP